MSLPILNAVRPGQAQILFLNRYGDVVNRSWVSGPRNEHYYVDYNSALAACDRHLSRCKEGAYVLINHKPKFTREQMDLELYRLFKESK